jgi:SAM-dependent methyltransferase
MLRAYGVHPEGVAAYLECGRATIDDVRRLAHQAGTDVAHASWVEIGAGYGRLVRLLAETVPPDRINAIELDPNAAQFCGDELRIRTLRSTPTFDVDTDEQFDIVFAISVMTHVDRAASLRFLRLGARLLQPGGAFVFTSHGEHALAMIGDQELSCFGGERDQLARELQRTGLVYRPYRFTRGEYGMTWHRPDVVRELLAEADPTLEVVAHEPGGLLGYQDLWAVRRPASR